jgi:L-malate glycosyltransferase
MNSGCDRLRILHIASGDSWGGAEALLLSLVAEQKRASPHDIRVILLNDFRLAAELQAVGAQVLILDESRFGFLRLLLRVCAEIKRYRPNVIHSHRQKENLLAAVGALLLRQGGRPRTVATVHGLQEPQRNASLRHRVAHSLNRILLRRAFDYVVVVSEEMRQHLAHFLPTDRVRRIHNGIDSLASSVQRQGPATKRLHLAAIGRLVPIKRYDRLPGIIDELTRLLGYRPLVTLAGDGPLEPVLRHQFAEHSNPASVNMVGHLRDVDSLLQASDGLLITSDHEGLPIVALEALRSGLPVFGFAVGGLPDLRADGAPVRLATPYDSVAFAQEIATFFSGSYPGRSWFPPADWEFSMHRCARSYLQLYESPRPSQE